VQTSPGICPDDPRGELVVDDPIVVPEPDEGCGCDVGGRPWAWSLLLLLGIARRR
jgi:MYXO-CTERM domain-containing protein